MADIMSFSPLWGEWHIKELVGKGTFGAVYKAEKEEYGETYTSAIKHISIPPENMTREMMIAEGVGTSEKTISLYCDTLRNQIINEIKFCYKLRGNTNIVSYEDHCIIPKASGIGYDIFIRMEMLTALPKYLAEHPFDQQDVIRLGISLCEALCVLDQNHMIHRDIKPANIFVNSLGTYKLGDFGESKVLSNSSIGMTVRGTYVYMSPEISKGESANITADIYSLGLVMYRLLNGNRAPFLPVGDVPIDSAAVESANIRRLNGESLPMPAYCSDRQLGEIILRACSFRPADRWQTPKAMKKALETVLERRTDPAGAQNSGLPVQPTGSFTQADGTFTQSAGTFTQSAGSSTQPIGPMTQPTGSFTQSAGGMGGYYNQSQQMYSGGMGQQYGPSDPFSNPPLRSDGGMQQYSVPDRSTPVYGGEPQGPKKSKKVPIIIGICVGVLLVVGGIIAVVALSGNNNNDSQSSGTSSVPSSSYVYSYPASSQPSFVTSSQPSYDYSLDDSSEPSFVTSYPASSQPVSDDSGTMTISEFLQTTQGQNEMSVVKEMASQSEFVESCQVYAEGDNDMIIEVVMVSDFLLDKKTAQDNLKQSESSLRNSIKQTMTYYSVKPFNMVYRYYNSSGVLQLEYRIDYNG